MNGRRQKGGGLGPDLLDRRIQSAFEAVEHASITKRKTKSQFMGHGNPKGSRPDSHFIIDGSKF